MNTVKGDGELLDSGANSSSGKNRYDKRRGGFFDWVDAGLKIVIAIIGVWISFLGYSYQKSFTSSQLLVQQEKGDTDIRAQMFGKITDRLMKPGQGQASLVQDALLAQVLALNFHELIDLKPLMLNLDSRLSKDIKKQKALKGSSPEESEQEVALKGLRSAARRIRDRQVAALVINPRPGSKFSVANSKRPDINGSVYYVNAVSSGSLTNNECFVKESEGKNGCLTEVMSVEGPNKIGKMYVSVDDADWDNQIFDVSLNRQKAVKDVEIILPKGTKAKKVEGCNIVKTEKRAGAGSKGAKKTSVQAGHKAFSVTWYDFPYTDNTLQANGERYSVFIDRVCRSKGAGSKEVNAVRLGILYFPKDYYPSRDRPVSYRQLSDKLGWD